MLNLSLTSDTCKPLMYARTNNDPKAEPCGTPVDIGKVFDLWPLYSTY